jgi:ATP-dependent RNA helicase DDX51/DBP6
MSGTSQLDEELASHSGMPESTVKPPKKRLRIQHSPHVEDVEPELKESEEPPAEAEIPPTLPFFPLPVLPDAPSKSVLAFQGLDQALVDAEVILPSRVLPIPSGKDDGGTRLSDRTRSRLRDIGITELFAGRLVG